MQKKHVGVGEIVLLKQSKENKLSTRFNPKPYQVVAIKGHMVTGTHGGHQVTCHASFFKKFKGKVDKKLIKDVSEDQDEEATYYAPEEVEAPQRRYPIRFGGKRGYADMRVCGYAGTSNWFNEQISKTH